jgi:hypothetical protein
MPPKLVVVDRQSGLSEEDDPVPPFGRFAVVVVRLA